MSSITYLFPLLNEAEETGFNDPLILNFTDPIYNLARESIQNIVDAKDPHAEGPAIAEFELLKIHANSLPDSERLKKIVEACWRHEREDKGEGEEFFKKAFNLINDNKTIDVLKISDYNTTGLYGDEGDRTGAYYKLMRIQGSSNKIRGMGGSYGLGKGAYFRPSLFRTIFVSSIWGDNNVVFQGKLRFVSHMDDGKMKHGIGLFSYPAIRENDDIPELFKRTGKGTSIFIIGFEEVFKWQKQMAESVLSYFWLAILDGLLEVKIGDLKINRENVEEKIFEYFSESKPFHKDNPIPYYKAYKEGVVIKKKLNVLGNVEFRILLKKDFPKRVEYFRNTGMVIQNRALNLGKGFAGVFICGDENEILRKMEDPTHSKWSKDVPTTSNLEEKKLYAEADKELKEFVESQLGELTSSIESTESTIKDLDKYFYSPAEDNEKTGEGNPESIEGQIVQEETGSLVRGENKMGNTPTVKIQVKIPVVTKGDPEGDGEGGGHGGGDGSGTGQGHPNEDGLTQIKINKDIKFKRSFTIKNGNNTEHIVLIAGHSGDKFDIEVRVGTEDSFDTIDISSVTDDEGNAYKIGRLYNKNGEVIRVHVKDVLMPENGSLKLMILFGVPGKYSLNLRAYENK